MRVLFACTPGTGHVHPLVPLAAEVRRRGHQVRWATNEPGVARIRALGIEAIVAGRSLAERTPLQAEVMRELVDVPVRARRPQVFGAFFGRLAAPYMREPLAAAVDDFRPHLVIHDVSELASAPVCAARGIPHVAVAFSGRLDPAILAPAAREVASVWHAEGLDVPDDLGLYDHAYLHPWPAALGQRPAAGTVIDSAHMGFDGRSEGGEPAWLAPLGQDRPLVYVSFGTEFGRFAPWADVFGALAELNVDAVVTVGHDLGVLGQLAVPPNVRVETYVPQSFLLERAAAMVSHAGAGSVAASVEHAVPLLAVPLGADQWDNADAVAAAGIGVTVEPASRSSAGIAEVILAAVGDAALAARCREVQAEMANMTGVPDVVDRLLALAGRPTA